MKIITCPQWKARQPRQPITTCPQAKRIIIHHTAGHHPELQDKATESRAESIAYAKVIQDFHMNSNGWIDSGHNFLVCRNGIVLQGRWLTVSSIQSGHMVVSAHCPGQNDQIGIEHEHLGTEEMTKEQFNASAELIAWISIKYQKNEALPLFPHSQFYNTSCPANLRSDIASLSAAANRILRT